MKKTNMKKLLVLSSLIALGVPSLASCDFVSKFIKTEEKVEENEKPTPVTIVSAEGISLDKNELTIEKGLSAVLKCSVSPENATDKKMDISLLGLVYPFNMFSPKEKKIEKYILSFLRQRCQ